MHGKANSQNIVGQVVTGAGIIVKHLSQKNKHKLQKEFDDFQQNETEIHSQDTHKPNGSARLVFQSKIFRLMGNIYILRT